MQQVYNSWGNGVFTGEQPQDGVDLTGNLAFMHPNQC